MVTDNNNGDDGITIDTFIFPDEEFFDPITGVPATGSPLPSPVPIEITIPVPVPDPVPSPVPVPIPVPDIELPDRPDGEFITSVELARALADMIELTRRMISDALAGIEARDDLVTQDAFQASLRDQALREVARTDLVDALFVAQSERVDTLESLLATGLSEIEERRLAEIAQVETATGFTPMAIFSILGDLLQDPIGYILEKSRDQIVEEISLGLNR